MRKILLVSVLFVLILIIAGCNNKNVTISVDEEMSRIKHLIPFEYNADIVLPAASKGFSVVYIVDGTISEDNIIEYDLSTINKEVFIEFTVSSKDSAVDSNILISQTISNQQYDILFEELVSDISSQIPSYISSNTSLPLVNNEFIHVDFNTDCTEIVRNRIVYSAPSETLQCNLNVIGNFKNHYVEEKIPFKMTAIDDLPKIPTIYITTEDNAEIVTKEYYIPGSVTLVIEGESEYSEILDAEMKIKLRGNSTLNMPKKPYKIKFSDEQALLSDYAEKKWVLLANHVDQTLLRDYLAFSMSSKIDIGFSPSFTFVDVFINGVYQGNYLLTDQVEVSVNRVNIEEKVSDVNTGYLVEYDIGLYREGLENTDENFFLIDEIPFVIKSPDFEDDHYVEEQKEYIEDYFNIVLDTLKNKEDYSSLIDESTFIDWFIVNEVFKNVDSGYSSVYFHKDKDGLLKMGPVWDFDISSGVPGYVSEDLRGPVGWWTPREDKNIFFYYLMQYPSFQENLKARWNEVYEDSIIVVLDEIISVSDEITQSRYNNFELWDIIGKEEDWYTSPEVYALKTYDEQLWFLYDYLKIRIEWLNTEINNFS